jgi:hypothetical protein
MSCATPPCSNPSEADPLGLRHFAESRDRFSARGAATVMWKEVAGATGLEPAASGVTGRRSNQLSYAPA